MKEIERKKENIKKKLETELYVERYDTFKKSVEFLNKSLESFGINYQYTYDNFCVDFTNECMDFIENYPEIDLMNSNRMMLYTLPILINIIEKAKNNYGFKNDKISSEDNQQ